MKRKAPIKYPRRFLFCCDDDFMKLLDRLSTVERISRADVIRKAILNRHAEKVEASL